MNQVAQLTDEEFALIKKALDMLANEQNFGKSLMKGLFLNSAPNVEARADAERIFKEEEEKDRLEQIERNDKITTIQYKLIQLKKFLAAKPGICSEAVASGH